MVVGGRSSALIGCSSCAELPKPAHSARRGEAQGWESAREVIWLLLGGATCFMWRMKKAKRKSAAEEEISGRRPALHSAAFAGTQQ